MVLTFYRRINKLIIIKNVCMYLFLDLCAKEQCSFYSKCVLLGGQTAECICSLCNNDNQVKPVCGSDGFTYSTVCQLRKRSCFSKKMISVVKNSPCGMFFDNLYTSI